MEIKGEVETSILSKRDDRIGDSLEGEEEAEGRRKRDDEIKETRREEATQGLSYNQAGS